MENITDIKKIDNVSFEFRPDRLSRPIYVKASKCSNSVSWNIRTDENGTEVTLQDLKELYSILQQIETINNNQE